MPGKPKTRMRKLENLGLAALEKAAGEIVRQHLAKDHPLSLTESDSDAMHAIKTMANQEFKDYLVSLLKLNTSKIATRIANEVDNIPSRHLPIAFGILLDKLRDLQGEPTQRVEVTRKGLSPDEFNKLLETLPKERIIDVTPEGDADYKENETNDA